MRYNLALGFWMTVGERLEMKVFKWDARSDDLGVIIPDEVIAGLGLQDGDEVDISANPDGSIVIARTSVKANDGDVSSGE